MIWNRRREDGASMVMVAVMMSVLLTLVAGTISFAAGSSQRVDLQNSADNTARAIMKECVKILSAGNVNSAGCPVSNTVSPWMLTKLRSGAGAAGANMTVTVHRKTIGGIANAPYMVTVNATRANTAPLTKVIGAENAQVAAESVVSYAVEDRYEPPIPVMADYCRWKTGGTGWHMWEIGKMQTTLSMNAGNAACPHPHTHTVNVDGPHSRTLVMSPDRSTTATTCDVAKPPSGAGGSAFWRFVAEVGNWFGEIYQNNLHDSCVQKFANMPLDRPFLIPLYASTKRYEPCVNSVLGICYNPGLGWPRVVSTGVDIVGYAEFEVRPVARPFNQMNRFWGLVPYETREPVCAPGSYVNSGIFYRFDTTTTVSSFLNSPVGCFEIEGRFTGNTLVAAPSGEWVMAEDVTSSSPNFRGARIKMVG